MTAPAWIALAVGIVTALANVVLVTRFISRIEARADVAAERFKALSDRVKSIERAIEAGRVVVFTGPTERRRPRSAAETGDGADDDVDAFA